MERLHRSAPSSASSGTDLWRGHDEAPPPPPHEEGEVRTTAAAGAPAALDPDAIAQRGALLAHWTQSADLAPDQAVAKLEAEAGNLEGMDRAQALARLDALGAEKIAETETKAETEGREADKAGEEQKGKLEEADAKDTQTTLKDPAGPHPVSVAPVRYGGPGKTPTRDEMKAEVETRTAAELSELDAKFDDQKAQLDARFADKLGSLDTEAQAQKAKVQGKIDKGSDETGADVKARQAAHQTQIGGEKAKHDADVATQGKPIAEQADRDAAQADADARAQADAARQGARTQADGVRAQAKGQAALARANGNVKAVQATTAAMTRAMGVPGGELAQVMADGQRRADQARAQGETTAKDIERKGEESAKQLIDRGEKDAQAALTRGAQAGNRARQQGTGGQARVAAQAATAHLDMQLQSAAAVGRMEAERKTMAERGGVELGSASGDMAAARQKAADTAAREKAEALAAMQKTYDAAKQKIEDKKKQNLERIDKTPDKNLAATKRLVDRDMKAMENTSEQAERQLKQRARRAEYVLCCEVQKQKQKIRARGAQAQAAIKKFILEAKKRIAAADKTTKKDIAAAAQRGREAIASEGAAALTHVTEANAADRAKVNEADDKDRAKLAGDAAAVQADLVKSAAEVGQKVDKEWVDDAVAEASKQLDDAGITNIVTDEEANRAMNVLNSLPADLQGKAIAGLPKDRFENLIDQVPSERREEFESLYKNCTDPERKLKLWGEHHKSKVVNTAKRDNDKEDTGSIWHWDTKAQDTADERTSKRAKIAVSTHSEVDDGIEKLMEAAKKSGKPLSAADVDGLIERKELEHVIEKTHVINLTNDDDAVWTKKELDDVKATLDRLPKAHVYDNANLQDIRRKKWAKGESVGAHSGGHIEFWGTGAGDMGDTKHHRMGVHGVELIQGTLTHEIGHNLADNDYEDQFDEIRSQAKWDKTWFKQDDAGRTENKNPYGAKRWTSHQTGAIPTDDSGHAGDWSYARNNEDDHFAELYTKMINLPAGTRQDMVDEQTTIVAREQAGLKLLKDAGMGPGNPAYEAQQANVARAEDNQRRLLKQYEVMRDQVVNPP